MTTAFVAHDPFAVKRVPGYHPGPPPERREPPGRRDRFKTIKWILYWIDCWRWRHHDDKDSPFWDYYRDKFMPSPYWHETHDMCLQRDGFRCTDTTLGKRCPHTITWKGEAGILQAHHKTYWDRWGKSLLGREQQNMWCLQTLCKPCHDARHVHGAKRKRKTKWLHKFWRWFT